MMIPVTPNGSGKLNRAGKLWMLCWVTTLNWTPHKSCTRSNNASLLCRLISAIFVISNSFDLLSLTPQYTDSSSKWWAYSPSAGNIHFTIMITTKLQLISIISMVTYCNPLWWRRCSWGTWRPKLLAEKSSNRRWIRCCCWTLCWKTAQFSRGNLWCSQEWTLSSFSANRPSHSQVNICWSSLKWWWLPWWFSQSFLGTKFFLPAYYACCLQAVPYVSYLRSVKVRSPPPSYAKIRSKKILRPWRWSVETNDEGDRT